MHSRKFGEGCRRRGEVYSIYPKTAVILPLLNTSCKIYKSIYLSSTCKIYLHSVTLVNKKTNLRKKTMTSRSYVVEEQNRLNNYAIEPKMYVDDKPGFGFTEYAEKLNGRLAMIGFVALIAIELVTGHGAIAWLTIL